MIIVSALSQSKSRERERAWQYTFYEKMDDFSSQLGMIKCSEIRHFSMKFPSEGEFWHCHFAGNKMGVSN